MFTVFIFANTVVLLDMVPKFTDSTWSIDDNKIETHFYKRSSKYVESQVLLPRNIRFFLLAI